MSTKRLQSERNPFTLIELLVVIAIIAILAAMLLPALSRARYQAKLLVDMGQLRQIAIAGSGYAASNDRFYPYRERNGNYLKPTAIKHDSLDYRPVLRETGLPINEMFNDVFAPQKMGLDDDPPAKRHEATVGSFWGFGYSNETVSKHMRRIGDAFVSGTNEFHVVASCWNVISEGRWVEGGHPDKAGSMRAAIWEGTGTYRMSRWENRNTHIHSGLDLNFAFDDGSVRTLRNVLPGQSDSRLTKTHWNTDASHSNYYLMLPQGLP